VASSRKSATLCRQCRRAGDEDEADDAGAVRPGRARRSALQPPLLTYPERPSLFGGAAGEALTRFVQNWCSAVLHPGLVSLIVLDIFEHLAPEDQDYFRTSRERRFGRTLEQVQAGREARLDEVRNSLQPLRMTLKHAPFLGGAQPLYADYLVFGAFQWARVISPFRVLEADDPVAAWLERCLDLHGGTGRAQAGYW
jgi:glutathione S-transferase